MKKTIKTTVRVTEKEMKEVTKVAKINKCSKAEAYRFCVRYFLSEKND